MQPTEQLIEYLKTFSEHTGYSASYLHSNCILHDRAHQAMLSLQEDHEWLSSLFSTNKYLIDMTFREALIRLGRNMLFRLAKSPDEVRAHYHEDQSPGLFETFLLIDQTHLMMSANRDSVLDSSVQPLVSRYLVLVTAMIQASKDHNLQPLTETYADTDNLPHLLELRDHLTRNQINEQVAGILLYKTSLFDHIMKNKPTTPFWHTLSSQYGDVVHGATLGHDISVMLASLKTLMPIVSPSGTSTPS